MISDEPAGEFAPADRSTLASYLPPYVLCVVSEGDLLPVLRPGNEYRMLSVGASAHF